MNKWIGCGRLTKDPAVKYNNDKAVARFNLAVNRRFSKDGEADFVSCVAFGKQGEFVEKYARKGMKFDVVGRIQTGNYKDKDGKTVYTTDVVVEEIEFGESKGTSAEPKAEAKEEPKDEGFMNVPDDDMEGLPFN
jgi:single-strand DNA-binding protein